MRGLALALLLAASPLAAFAADEAHEAEHAGGHDAAAAAAHRKEFTYEVINLALLIAVLGYFVRKPVKSYLATRRDAITRNIASSEQLLQGAEAKLAEWNAKVARLDADVASILDSTRKGAETEKAAILADAEATAARIRQSAGAVVERELRAAREALRGEAADLALTLAAKLLREQVNADDRNRLVDEFVAKLESGAGGER